MRGALSESRMNFLSRFRAGYGYCQQIELVLQQLSLYRKLASLAWKTWKMGHFFQNSWKKQKVLYAWKILYQENITDVSLIVDKIYQSQDLVISGLDRNRFARVWNNACHFYLSFLRLVMNFLLNRTFLGMHYKNYISEA